MVYEKKNYAADRFESMTMLNQTSEELLETFDDMLKLKKLYSAALKVVTTKLETLDDELHLIQLYSPIHHIESRLKQPQSIFEKLSRKGFPVNAESAMEHLTDIAGIRVICNYANDIYTICDLLAKQNDVTLIRKTDYIKEPKANGYRSLHIVVSVPVFLSNKKEFLPVEIQIRTIAMDFWASLEHQLRYKASSEVQDDLYIQLKKCAEEIHAIDLKMQRIQEKLDFCTQENDQYLISS